MQIISESSGDSIEFRVTGRLDNESSEQLSTAIQDAVREGSHSVRLDLSGIDYISSAGVGTLVKAHKQLQSLRGFFGIVAISPEAVEVIQLTGLEKMLLSSVGRPADSKSRPTDTLQSSLQISARGEMVYEVYDLDPEAELTCEVFGRPETFAKSRFQAADCQPVEFPNTTLGLGLGAFGRDFDDCANRFGEFLSVSGATAQQPTNASVKPDFQRTIGDFVPTVQSLYGLKCQGGFKQLVRFERSSNGASLTLSSMVHQFLKVAEADTAAMVLLAESAGLIGASLRRSPAEDAGASASRFQHPEIRRWLSFTPNHAYGRTLTLAVGVVSQGAPTGAASPLGPLLRPLAANLDVYGHFHAAVFSYRPFKKRRLNLNEAVFSLLETEDLQAVLHLLHDDRKISGGGESEFVSGACWLGPISHVTSVLAKQAAHA